MNIEKQFTKMGYRVLSLAKKNTNGPDMHVIRNGVVLRVEIKTACVMKRIMTVNPVESLRQNDDLIAIIFPSGYVLIEPMKDHLKACAPNGSRSFFGMY